MTKKELKREIDELREGLSELRMELYALMVRVDKPLYIGESSEDYKRKRAAWNGERG